MIKVGVWGPGSMGVIALRGVIDHPELQLVDLVVHSDAKAGRDAGELCGIAPVGVVATQDPAAMLAGDADAVVYAAGANLRPLEAVEDMVSILRAGKNVVSCSVVPLVFPDGLGRKAPRSPIRCGRPHWTAARRFSPPASTPGSPMTFCRWCLPGFRGSSIRCG